MSTLLSRTIIDQANPAADSLTSMNHDVSDCCPDVTTFGDTRRMVHCLAEHVIHSE